MNINHKSCKRNITNESNGIFQCFSVPLIIISCFVLYHSIVSSSQWSDQSLERSGTPWKKIFVFTPLFGRFSLWEKMFRRIVIGQCPESRCQFLSNQKDLREADAVLFSVMDLPKRAEMNRRLKELKINHKIRKKQIWILVIMNPPSDIIKTVNLKSYNNFFNWTLSYRTDSDIWSPFGFVFPRKTGLNSHYLLRDVRPDHVTLGDLFESKNSQKPGVAIFSSCSSKSKRERYLMELSRYIKIDTFGRCSKNILGGATRNLFHLNPERPDETEGVIPKYFFYMAFEKDICKDFLTEHFYRALRLGSVPVIRGPITNSSLAPPNSFIDASQFESPKKLAEFLKRVAESKKKYLRYHSWRKDLSVQMGFPYDVWSCDVCSKLHEHRSQQILLNIGEIWSEDSSCSRETT